MSTSTMSGQHGHRPRMTKAIKSCVPGDILWLRSYSQQTEKHLAIATLEISALSHPVVVIASPPQSPEYFSACLLTSLNGHLVQRKFRGNDPMRSAFLPISPQSPITRTGVILHLAEGELRKPCYVRIDRLHTVHHALLESYDRSHPAGYHRLDPSSMVLLNTELAARNLISLADMGGANPAAATPSPAAPSQDVIIAEDDNELHSWPEQLLQASEPFRQARDDQSPWTAQPMDQPLARSDAEEGHIIPLVGLVVVASIVLLAFRWTFKG